MVIRTFLFLVLFLLFALLFNIACSDDDDNDDDNNDDESPSEFWTDSETGLTWQNQIQDQGMDWEPAKSYCKSLKAGGHSDWRLPTFDELRTLVRGCDGTETAGGCGINNDCLSEKKCWNSDCNGCEGNDCFWPSDLTGKCGTYWSSSVSEDPPVIPEAWQINFLTARPVSIDWEAESEPEYNPETFGNYVRCVR